jgi:hypothetical protein
MIGPPPPHAPHEIPHNHTPLLTTPNFVALPPLLSIAQLPGEGVKIPQIVFGEVGIGGSRSSPGL